jgi:hypothetical protein
VRHLQIKPRYGHVDKGDGKIAWLVNPPCVGSTWLSRILTDLLSWHLIWPLPKALWRREQDVIATKAFMNCTGNVFMPHTHTRWNDNTKRFVRDFDPKIIIMYRDLLDNVISIADHCRLHDQGLSIGFADDDFGKLSPESSYDHVIAYMLPWVLNFYASWEYAERVHDVHPLYVDYADLLGNPTAECGRILSYLGESRSAAEIAHALKAGSDKDQTRFNVGKAGRGSRLLNDAQKLMIMELRDSYGGQDKIWMNRVMQQGLQHGQLQPLQPHHDRGQSKVHIRARASKTKPDTDNKDSATRRLRPHDSGNPDAPIGAS